MGIPPDTTPRPSGHTPTSLPLELPRLLLAGALGVAALGIVLALVLGLWRAREDMRDELEGASTLARMQRLLAEADTLDDARLLEALRREQAAPAMRHLQLKLRDAAGRSLLEPPEPPALPLATRALVALADAVLTPPPSRSVAFRLVRPGGRSWSGEWIASHDGEQREAMEQLLRDLAVLVACVGLMLLVMRWHVRRSFRPLAPLLGAIGALEREDLGAMRALPTMPIRELEAIAGSLRHLSGALEQAEKRRRVLGTKLLTSQEEERGRVARELHDELGQHLTALRADATWLERRLAAAALPELARVAAGMQAQCARVQQAVRSLLSRLRPLGEGQDETLPLSRLRGLLEGLVESWSRTPGCAMRLAWRFDPADLGEEAPLPAPVVLAVYRASQEALTNVARHAGARQAELRVALARDSGGALLLQWSVHDDGRGMPDVEQALQRGSGLAGLKERLWAAGGDLELGPGPEGRGLRLAATLRLPRPARDATVQPALSA